MQSLEDLIKSAESGNSQSQYDLGEVYFYGLYGQKKDIDKAIFWFEKAAAQNNEKAKEKLKILLPPEDLENKNRFSFLNFDENKGNNASPDTDSNNPLPSKVSDSEKNSRIFDFDFGLINEYFAGLKRQGPGSPEATIRALSFIDNLSSESKIADLGCGTGSQTMVLAQNTKGTIIALDLFPGSIDKLNINTGKLGLHNRVKGIVGSMDDLSFQNGEFDLIWSEGAIANIGFEKGLNHWKGFLKKGGYIAATYESWFTDERPAEIEKWWFDAVPEISTIGHNISIMQKTGYVPVAAFTLHENCWIDNYFIPQKTRQEEFLKKHVGNKTVETFIAFLRREAELYSKYKQYYGYVFYIGKKI